MPDCRELARLQDRAALSSREIWSVRWSNWKVRDALPAFVQPRAVAFSGHIYIFNADSPQILRLHEQEVAPSGVLPADAFGVAATVAGDAIVIFTGSRLLRCTEY
jgi:hypothetical protein